MQTQVFVNLNNATSRPRAMMTARKRKPCGKRAGLGDSILNPPSTTYLNLENAVAGAISPVQSVLQLLAPSGAQPLDTLANELGKPLTQDEINALNAQTASQVQQACGNQANTAWCNQQIQSAQAAVTAAAQQSNQQLAGPPYSYVLAAENYLNKLTPPSLPSLPSWFWWAAAAVGFVLIYEAA